MPTLVRDFSFVLCHVINTHGHRDFHLFRLIMTDKSATLSRQKLLKVSALRGNGDLPQSQGGYTCLTLTFLVLIKPAIAPTSRCVYEFTGIRRVIIFLSRSHSCDICPPISRFPDFFILKYSFSVLSKSVLQSLTKLRYITLFTRRPIQSKNRRIERRERSFRRILNLENARLERYRSICSTRDAAGVY